MGDKIRERSWSGTYRKHILPAPGQKRIGRVVYSQNLQEQRILSLNTSLPSLTAPSIPRDYLALICCSNNNWAVLLKYFPSLISTLKTRTYYIYHANNKIYVSFPSASLLMYNLSVSKLAWPQGLGNILTPSLYSTSYTQSQIQSYFRHFKISHSKLPVNSLM